MLTTIGMYVHTYVSASKQVIKVIQSLSQLPDGQPRAELLCQLDALLDRVQGGIEYHVSSRFDLHFEEVLLVVLVQDQTSLVQPQVLEVVVGHDRAASVGRVIVPVHVQSQQDLGPSLALLRAHVLHGILHPVQGRIRSGPLQGREVVGHERESGHGGVQLIEVVRTEQVVHVVPIRWDHQDHVQLGTPQRARHVLDQRVQERVLDPLGQTLPHLQHNAIESVLLAGVQEQLGHRLPFAPLTQQGREVVALELVEQNSRQN